MRPVKMEEGAILDSNGAPTVVEQYQSDVFQNVSTSRMLFLEIRTEIVYKQAYDTSRGGCTF